MATTATNATVAEMESQIQTLVNIEAHHREMAQRYRDEAVELDRVAYKLFTDANAIKASCDIIDAAPISAGMTLENKSLLLDKLKKEAERKLSARTDYLSGPLRQAQIRREAAQDADRRADAYAADAIALRAALQAAVHVLP